MDISKYVNTMAVPERPEDPHFGGMISDYTIDQLHKIAEERKAYLLAVDKFIDDHRKYQAENSRLTSLMIRDLRKILGDEWIVEDSGDYCKAIVTLKGVQ